MLAANVIPKELTIFMKEKMDIDSLEIPISFINKIAERYKYNFSDKETPQQKTTNKEIVRNFIARSDKPRTWIFQANPQRFDILNALSDNRLEEDVWLVSQHKKEIKKGDIGLIWMSLLD